MKYLSLIVKAIKEKPELNEVDSEFIAGQVLEFLTKHSKIETKLDSSTTFNKFQHSKEYKQILKSIRAKVRKSYALFQLDPQLRKELFNKLKQNPKSLTIHKKLLETHRSTNERISIYPKLYKDLFKITGEPESILDLGCGLNPLSLPWMNLEKVNYIAVELNQQDLNIIQDYFKLKDVQNKALPIDLTKNYSKLQQYKVDLCFMFKLLDSLENIQKNITEPLIKNIQAKYIIASFSTKSVGGKIMQNTRRRWFEYIIKGLDFQFRTIEYDNEIFYIITKTDFAA